MKVLRHELATQVNRANWNPKDLINYFRIVNDTIEKSWRQKDLNRDELIDNDYFWLCDNITSIKPKAHAMKVFIKGSTSDIINFEDYLFGQFETISNKFSPDKKYRRMRKLTLSRHKTKRNTNNRLILHVLYGLKNNFRINHQTLDNLTLIFYYPDRNVIQMIDELIKCYRLTYSISSIEFAFDIHTSKVNETFRALCQTLKKKRTKNAFRCFENRNGSKIWIPFKRDEFYTYYRTIPLDASLYLDDRKSRAWIKMYVKRNEGIDKIRIEYTSTRPHLRDSLHINQFSDIYHLRMEQLTKDFEFVTFDVNKYSAKLFEFWEKKRTLH